MRLTTYYIPINQQNYMRIHGVDDNLESIGIYSEDNIKFDIMTKEGLENFVHGHGGNNFTVIFELDAFTYNGNIDDLVLLLTKLVKKIVPF